jgi:hypothetical protein
MPVPEFLELRSTNLHAGNLSGCVGQDERCLLVGATVKLFCDEKVCGETKTDANGKFIFFNLPPRDDYAIRIVRSGYYAWQGADYNVQAGYDATYGPIFVSPRRRVKLSRAASTVRYASSGS